MKSFCLKATVVLISTITLIVSLVLASVPYARLFENNEKIEPMVQGNLWLSNVRLSKKFSEPGTHKSKSDKYDVEINNGHIVHIEPAGSINLAASGKTIIDGEGRWLFPGLIDLHVHVFDKSELFAYLAHGVTTVRNMMGFPVHLRWRNKINAQEITGPNILTASPTLNFGSDGGPFHKYVNSADEVDRLVRLYQQQGYDLIKFYDGLTPEMYEQLASTAHEINMPFAGHPIKGMGILTLLAAKPSSIEHIEEIFNGPLDYNLDISKASSVIDSLAKQHVPLVTTMTAYENIYLASEQRDTFLTEQRLSSINPLIRWIGMRQLAPVTNAEHKKWIIDKDNTLHALLNKFREQNVPLVLGTDTGPAMTVAGRSVEEEMQLLLAQGFSPEAVLSMATSNAAKVLRKDDISGLVRIGEQANLLLLEVDPMEDLETVFHPWAVIMNGQMYGQAELKKMQDLSRQHQSVYQTMGYFLEHYLTL